MKALDGRTIIGLAPWLYDDLEARAAGRRVSIAEEVAATLVGNQPPFAPRGAAAAAPDDLRVIHVALPDGLAAAVEAAEDESDDLFAVAGVLTGEHPSLTP